MEKQRELDIQFMAQALELAAEATKKGNEPFGAVLVKDNQVVMTGKITYTLKVIQPIMQS